jgi:hypothetical protein
MIPAAKFYKVVFGRVFIAAVLIVTFLMLAPTSSFAQTRRAVLAGINTYVPEGTTAKKIVLVEKAGVGGRGSWTNLEGSLNDVESIRQLLITRYGFEEKNIHVLTEAEATHENILKAIQTYLADPAAPGDISFFYYAGHGSQMHNSKSPEEDKQDETTVPSDSYKGTTDIRDKEYARYFMKVIEKGALLTAIFDSCHSGSIARGYSRFDRIRALPPDPRDAADDYAGPFPEKRGALVLAAAQDIESAAEGRDENGNEHGAFTAALMKVLSSAPLDESANDIFLQTFATMRSAGASQVPVISGPADRIRAPLFGTSSGNLSGKITLPVITADGDGTVQLLGGFSLGFGIGTELVPAKKSDAEGPVRLKVTAQTPGKSTAKTLAGDVSKLNAGMLFVVDRWAPSGKGLLALWVPPADLTIQELKHTADGVNALRALPGITVVDDPYEVTPTHIVSWNGTAWVLTDQSTQATKPLGRTPDLVAMAKGLPSGKTKIFVNLPLPKESSAGVAALTGGPSPVRAVSSIREANYLLVGRATAKGIEYAWLLPGASKDAHEPAPKKAGEAASATTPAPPASSLPPETRWVAAQSGSNTFETAIAELTELAGNLSRINGWLTLPSPADDGGFPYHLELYESKHPDSKDPVTATYGDGRSYGLALRADPKDLKRFVGPRRVYIFVIDSDGNGVPVFPNLDMGDVENVHPTPAETSDGVPTEIKLGPVDLFTVGKPFGTDTYFLLTTAPQDSINLASLAWEGVRGGQRGAESPLDQLLSTVGTRSPRPATPASWSITKIPIHSQPEP